jgi:hypothetical protein
VVNDLVTNCHSDNDLANHDFPFLALTTVTGPSVTVFRTAAFMAAPDRVFLIAPILHNSLIGLREYIGSKGSGW